MIPSMMQVFDGPNALSGIALATIFHIIHMGGELRTFFLNGVSDNEPEYEKQLINLLTDLFRIEAKFPVRYVLPPGSRWWAYFAGNQEDGDDKNVQVVDNDHSKGVTFKNDQKPLKGELQIPDYKVTDKIDPHGRYI